MESAMARILGPEVGVAVSSIQIPAFVGEGSLLSIETEQALDPESAARLLDVQAGVEVWEDDGDDAGPTTRDATGRDDVLVGRIRSDDSLAEGAHGLQLWLSCDPVRLSAANAVSLARARLVRQ
jgi:aspartate-semialdehyde dehydrogenase